MDDFFITVILTAIATTFIVAPVSYWLGYRHKNRRWLKAVDTLKRTGLFLRKGSQQ